MEPGGGNLIAVPPGATAALIRIAVTNTQGPGFLKAYSAALTTDPPPAANTAAYFLVPEHEAKLVVVLLWNNIELNSKPIQEQ